MDVLEKNLYNTCVSVKWISEILLESTDMQVQQVDSSVLPNFKVEQLGVGVGFLSHILRIHLEWAEEIPRNCGLPNSVVIKAPTTDKIQAKLDNFHVPESEKEQLIDKLANEVLKRFHQIECSFYEMVRKGEGPAVAVPKVFYCRDTGSIETGVIVMEDLSEAGIIMNFYKGLNTWQVYNIVDEITNLQLFSLTTHDWKSRVTVIPKEHFLQWSEFLKSTLDGFSAAGLHDLRKSTEKVMHLLEPGAILQTVQSHQTLGLPGVMAHGDTWINNMLFKRDTPNEVLAVVDWQMLHIGNLAEDIAVLLASSVRAEERRQQEAEILRYYYESLTKKMNDIGKEVPFSLQDVHRAYKRIFPFAVGLYVLFWFSLMTSDLERPDKQGHFSEVVNRCQALLDDLNNFENSRNI